MCRATLIGYFAAIDMGELGQRHRAGDHVFDAEARSEFSSAGGELDDAVAARVGETFHGGVDGFRADAVDRRKGVLVLLGAPQHLGVDIWRCDGHEFSS